MFFLPLLLLSGCSTSFGYLWKQGGYLIRYSVGAESISAMLRNPTTSPDLRRFLRTVTEVRQFAVEDIGLADNRDYTTYKRIDRDYLVNVVQAADPLSFISYEWRYPLFGKLPYKGYYDRADARAEAERLERKGYDVIVRKVDAFSTLGFFRDPIYSFMEKYAIYDLASLIIHEKTHTTLFLKGQDQFNEELATYVGDQGALEFLRSIYGAHSAEYEKGTVEQSDNTLFVEFIAQLRSALSAVYDEPIPRAEKRAEKAKTIAEYRKIYETEYLPRFRTERYRDMTRLPINNAYLMLFGLYTREIPLLARYNQEFCGGNLKTFMAKMEALSKRRGNMIERIRKAVSAGHPVPEQ